MSFQGAQLRPFVRRDRTAECGPLLPPGSDSEPNVIVRQFTLQKGKFCSESEDKNALVIAAASQVHKDDGKKIFESSEAQSSNPFNQRFIPIHTLDSSKSTVGSRQMQETTKDVVTESNTSKIRTITGPQGSKTLPLILAKGTRLGMLGGKLVMLQSMPGTRQVVRDLGQAFLTKNSNSVYKKVELTSDDLSGSEINDKNSNSGAEVSVIKSSVSSGEAFQNQMAITKDTKKLHTILPTAPKQVNTEATTVKESPTKSCQLKPEMSNSGSKGCFILPLTNLNHSNNGEIVKLSTSAQSEVKVINTIGNQMLSANTPSEGKVISTIGNHMQPILVKPSIEGKPNTSTASTFAETVLTSSPQKKAVVLTTGLKPGQPILKLAEVPGNSAGAKTYMLTTNKSSGEKSNGNIKYVALPGHIMLPKLLPGTKVYTTAAVSQKNVAVTGVSTFAANKVVAAPTTTDETNTVATVAPVQQLNAPKMSPLTPNQTSTNKIELKVEVDQKGDVVGVIPKTQLVNEHLDNEKVKATVHGSWALLQKRCNQAMELKKKVLQKEKCKSRIRKVPHRTVTEVDRGTQTSFFSLVEPGRLVEIQLEEENLNEGDTVKENSTEKTSTENVTSHRVNMSSEVNSTTGNIYEDAIEPPERKKLKTGKPMTVYDVLVQHNIQAMSEKTAKPNSEQPLIHKLPKRHVSVPAPPLAQPSCSSPTASNPGVSAQLNSPGIHDNSRLNTPEMRRQLLEDFVQCIQRDNCGNIRLHTAVYYEQIQLVKRHCALLNARKSSLDIHNDDMETPLHMAVMLRNVEIIRILLSFGAKVAVTDGSGNTALHLAVLEGNEEVLNVLLNHSTGELPLNTFNDEGLAPLHLCAQAAKLEEAKALLRKGAEIDLRDAKSGRTPLFHAVERNAVKLVKMFLDLGANANLPNFSGHTALLAANEYCDIPNPPITKDPLCTTPKLRPFRADDTPMVAALVGLSTDLESQMFLENEQTLSRAEER